MIRTQIQLPDELYRRAKRFGAEREMSLAEMTRRGLELLLESYPAPETTRAAWKLPTLNGGGLRVPLKRLSEFAVADEETRSICRR